MIRHLPIMNCPSDQKKEISTTVQSIIDSLQDNDGTYSKEVLSQIRYIDKSVFDLYGLEKQEREMIIKDIQKRIEYFRNIYA